MKNFFLNIALFEKNRGKIEEKNYKALFISGMTFIVVSLIECIGYYFFNRKDTPFCIAIYSLVLAVFLILLRSLHKKGRNISPVICGVWYLIGTVFVCHTYLLHNFDALLFNYAVIVLTLSVIMLLMPVVSAIYNLFSLAVIVAFLHIVSAEALTGSNASKIIIICLLSIIVSLVVTYLRMENIMFESSLFLLTGDNGESVMKEQIDPYWSGRNKYGILSGECVGQRKVFALVFSLSKEKLIKISDNNFWGLSDNMYWDDVKRIIIDSAIDPGSRMRLSSFLDITNMKRQYHSGKRRISTFAGFGVGNGQKKWFDFECTMTCHPISGDLFGSVLVEDITEDRILMGVFNKMLEQNYDFVMCVECDQFFTMTFEVEAGQEIHGVYGDVYDTEIKKYIRDHVAKHDMDKAYSLTDMNCVREILGKEKMHEFLLDEEEADGNLSKKLFRYSYLDPSHNFLCMIKQDVTEVIKKEDEAKARLAEALKERETAMNARSEFMTRMSHEMRTPMNAILGLSSLMMDEINNPEAMRDYISKIQYSGQFLLQLINDVLDITKMEQDKFVINSVSYSMSDFWEAIDTMIGPMCIKKGVDFEWKSSIPEHYYINTDPLRITQIFINLLSNAIKYTPKGGHIWFECREVSREGNKTNLVFNVKDDGIGMSEEFQKHMFEAFTQESKEVNTDLNGTGLGLSIVKGIVEALGGEIKVNSEVGVGTDFEVSFTMEISEEGTKRQVADADTDLSGLRILVVEDNDINREIAVAILEKRGILSEVAVNGQEAVEKFSSHAPDYYDMILMDIRMPVMSGLTATKRIRAMERDDAKTIPIIAMTANAFSKDVAASLEAGLNEHLSKPIDPKVLYRTIAKYMS